MDDVENGREIVVLKICSYRVINKTIKNINYICLFSVILITQQSIFTAKLLNVSNDGNLNIFILLVWCYGTF